jgi:hypothetical protein
LAHRAVGETKLGRRPVQVGAEHSPDRGPRRDEAGPVFTAPEALRPDELVARQQSFGPREIARLDLQRGNPYMDLFGFDLYGPCTWPYT